MKSLSILLASLASANAAEVRGVIGLGGSPHEISDADFAAYFRPEVRNATGSVTFDGYNISAAFPPNTTLPGWTATIDVATSDFGSGSIPYPGTRITFTAPEGLDLPANASESGWHSCIAIFPPEWLKKSVRRKKPDDDGESCSFLSDDCQMALQAAANSYFWYTDADPPECTGSIFIPEQCEGEADEDSGGSFGYSPNNLSDMFNGSTAISRAPYISGGDGPEATKDDVEDAYDISVGGYWTILLNWGRRSSQQFSSDEVPQGSVICLKADELQNGSTGDAARPRINGGAVLALVVGFFAASSLL